MTTLTDEALEFARAHISKYYDSDFFPKPREFLAIWYNWDDVKKEIAGKNIAKAWVTPPRIMACPKPSGDFRVVHQLEPLDAIIYTALAYEVANEVELARASPDKKVACSYRFDLSDGNFFAGGTGYRDFVEQTEFLADNHDYILVTDITDFYNQIYLHRLNNSIEYADASLKQIADDIENFITKLNNKASQGVPVGPAASIVMSEAVLIDIDEFIKNKGMNHVRYVDDFRIFGDSVVELRELLEALTLYLYKSHRLVLSSAKTHILKAHDYIKQNLHNAYTEEKIQLFKNLEVFNPYTEEVEEIEVEVDDDEELLMARLIYTVDKIKEFRTLDLGLARSVIRRARRHRITDILQPILTSLDFFAPVINDVVLYLDEVYNENNAPEIRELLKAQLDSKALNNGLVRYWIEWHLSAQQAYLADAEIYNFVRNSPYFTNRARAAITLHDLAWVREQKDQLYHLGSWERRALLDAARVLPGDERNHWLKLTEGSSPVPIDRWMAKWVRETA